MNDKPRAYRQGELDWLCSLYAAVNLRQLYLGRRDEGADFALFSKLVKLIEADPKGDLRKALLEGIWHCRPDDMKWLLEESGFNNVQPINWTSAMDMRKNIKDRAGVVLFFKGPKIDESHFTVVKNHRSLDRFRLFDSYNYKWLDITKHNEFLSVCTHRIRPIKYWAADFMK